MGATHWMYSQIRLEIKYMHMCVCVCVCVRVGYLLHSSNDVWFGAEKPQQHTFQIPRSRDFILFKMQWTQVFQILVCSCPKFIQFFEGYCVWMVLIWCYAQVAHCHRPEDVTTEGKGGKHTRVEGKQARKACEVFPRFPVLLEAKLNMRIYIDRSSNTDIYR